MRCSRRYAAFALLTACTVGPDYTPPETPEQVPEQFAAVADPAFLPGKADLVRWWSVFGDAQLDALIARAGRGNLDLAIAVSRVSEARARLGFSKAGRAPQVGFAASPGGARTGAALCCAIDTDDRRNEAQHNHSLRQRIDPTGNFFQKETFR